MNRSTFLWAAVLVGVFTLTLFFPELALAGQFEQKMGNLSRNLVSVVLPLISTLGLIYAVFLAVTGDGAARGRIVIVIGASVMGFLAPHLIEWLKSTIGTGGF